MHRTRSGEQGCRGRLHAGIREEAGQSLVIVLISMFLILGLAALAVDAAQWKVAHHQAQVAADAAALAAANCLATRDCTSTATGHDAYTKATDYATKNGVPANGVNIAGGAVTVTTQTTAPETFAGVFGVHPTVTARAVASYTAGVTATSSVYGADCATPTNPPTTGCAINCSSPGVSISTNGHTSITGAIETNGYVDINIGGTTSLGPVQSGPGVGTTCGQNISSVGGNASIADGPANATGFTAFPTTYSAVWTSASSNECSATSSYTGAGFPGSSNISLSGGTGTVPSTITLSGNSQTFGNTSGPGVVMCASTSISIPGNSATLNHITLVAPTISIGGNNFKITAAPSALADGGGGPPVALYDTSGATLNFGSNDVYVTGAVYAPLAEIYVGGNNGGSAELEGNTVEIDGNNGGDGPATTLTAFSGSDQLAQ